MSRTYLALILPATVLLALITAPFNAPDETAHFLRAAAIARGGFLPEAAPEGKTAGGRVDAAVAAFISDQWEHLQASLVGSQKANLAQIVAARPRHPEGKDVYAGHSNTAIYPPLLYLPSAFALALADALGLPLIDWLYLARIVNALLASAIVALAIRRAGDAAAPAFVVAALPTSTFLVATLSTDALLLPIAVLFASLSARLAAGDLLSRSDASWLSLAVILLAIGKIAYLPLCLVPPILAWRVDRALSARVAWFLALAIFSLLGWLGWAWIVHDKVFGIRPGVAIDAFGQIHWMWHHPSSFFEALARTMSEQGVAIARGAIGSPLGWFDIVLPDPLLLGWCGILAFVTVAAPYPCRRDPVAVATVLGIVALEILVTSMLLYVQYNPVGASRIDGLQGRYFLPLIALLACVAGKVRLPPRGWAAVLPGLIAVGVLSTLVHVYRRFW